MGRNEVEGQAVADSSGQETMAGASELAIDLAGSLPQRMKATLQGRLSQLSPPAREVAEVAATIGRSFSVALLAQAGAYPEDELWQNLDELWQRHILTELGAVRRALERAGHLLHVDFDPRREADLLRELQRVLDAQLALGLFGYAYHIR